MYLEFVWNLKNLDVQSKLKMDRDCKSGLNEKMPAGASLLERNGGLKGGQNRFVCYHAFFPIGTNIQRMESSSLPCCHETLS